MIKDRNAKTIETLRERERELYSSEIAFVYVSKNTKTDSQSRDGPSLL